MAYTCFACLGADHRRCERLECACNLCGQGIRKYTPRQPRKPRDSPACAGPRGPRSDKGKPRPNGEGTGRQKPGPKVYPDRDNRIRQLVEEGELTLSQIGWEVGLVSKTVRATITRLGLDYTPKNGRRTDIKEN